MLYLRMHPSPVSSTIVPRIFHGDVVHRGYALTFRDRV